MMVNESQSFSMIQLYIAISSIVVLENYFIELLSVFVFIKCDILFAAKNHYFTGITGEATTTTAATTTQPETTTNTIGISVLVFSKIKMYFDYNN